jgi:predicted acetyltransferase
MAGAPPTLSPSGRNAVVVRPARESDLERVLEIHVGAFPDPRPIEARRRVFLHNRLGEFKHLRVAERAGELLAHAFTFPITAWFGGREVRGSAIASVGVAPEARGQGLASDLFASMHAEAEAGGGVFTLLYPFRQAFYARLGYAPVSRYRVLTASPRAIPATWKEASPGIIRCLRAADRAELDRVYRDAARHRTGAQGRPERAWECDLLDERRQWLVLEQDGAVAGYATFHLQQSEPHARVRAEVYEVVASEDGARRRLFAALGALGDQVGDLVVALAEDDPMDWGFIDGDRDRGGTADVEHPLGVFCAGPMIRLLDSQAALRARGYAGDGTMSVTIDDQPPFTLDVRGGAAHTSPAHAQASLHTSATVLASVAFGGMRLEDAARLGWVRATDLAALGAASRLLRLPAFFSVDGF